MKTMLKRTIAGALLSGGVAIAGLGLAAGTAQADPGYGTWCPGQPLPVPYQFKRTPDGGLSMTGPLAPDVNWDMSACHDWHRKMIDHGDGTLTNDTIEGSVPRMNCGPGWCPVPPGAGT